MAYHVIEGNVVGKKEKIGIVCARFNEFIVSKLLGGAIDGLVRHGISEENIDVAWVPGAFEIPLICEKMVKTGKYDAVIALGTVIRGSTSHYDYVCNEVSQRCCTGWSAGRRSGNVRNSYNRKYRAGNRTCRNKSRKQRL